MILLSAFQYMPIIEREREREKLLKNMRPISFSRANIPFDPGAPRRE